jgi:hypothetical protein
MRLGKLTTTLLVSPILLGIVLIPGLIVASIFGLGHSVWSLLVYGLLLLLLGWCFGYLGKRWPTVFGVAAVEGGPRLTKSRVFLLCGTVLLCVATVVFVNSAIQLTRLQTALVYGFAFGFLLLMINLFEGRWRLADERSRSAVVSSSK